MDYWLSIHFFLDQPDDFVLKNGIYFDCAIWGGVEDDFGTARCRSHSEPSNRLSSKFIKPLICKPLGTCYKNGITGLVSVVCCQWLKQQRWLNAIGKVF
jgi:hypothetical protein